LLSGLSGTGGLDLKAGAMKTWGASGYSGSVTLEQALVKVLGTANGTSSLGTGPVGVASPTGGGTWTSPVIDASAVPGGVTLDNDVTIQDGADVEMQGLMTLIGKLLLDQQGAIKTKGTTDKVTVEGEVGGAGTLTVGGSGTTAFLGGVIPGGGGGVLGRVSR